MSKTIFNAMTMCPRRCVLNEVPWILRPLYDTSLGNDWSLTEVFRPDFWRCKGTRDSSSAHIDSLLSHYDAPCCDATFGGAGCTALPLLCTFLSSRRRMTHDELYVQGTYHTSIPQMKGRWGSNINMWFQFMYSQKWNCMAVLFPNQNYNVLSPSSTFMCMWAIISDLYIPRSVCLFCCRQIGRSNT